jgi:hypothetical protein
MPFNGRRGLLRLVVLSWVSALIVGAACLVYTNRTARNSERKWCDLINTLVAGYQSTPSQPTTPRGRELQRLMLQLRDRLGCS